jgi:hypothetical protein
MGRGVSELTDFTDFTDNGPDDGPDGDLVRQQGWPVDGPVELELTVDVGRIRVHLDEQIGDAESGAGEVRVEVRHDPSAGNAWSQGLTGLMNWLGGATGMGGGQGGLGGIGGAFGGSAEDVAAEAVRAAEISWSDTGKRLVVRSSQELPLRVVPIAITVSAPAGSRLAARTGAGDVRVTGRAGWAGVRTGSGRATVGAVDGDADVQSGSGDIELGPVSGRARVRTGSGTVTVAGTGGPTEIKTGSGDIAVGQMDGDLGVRTGSGDVSIADARAGRCDITTGSGELRIGVHAGVGAELDLSSGSGKARSEFDVGAVAPEKAPALHLRGRTGSGDVLVTRAVQPV